MAGAFLTFFLKRLSTWALNASSSSSTGQELHNLERTMKKIHAILKKAEEKDIDDKSEQLRLRELKEVVYDAEDVMDEYDYEVLHGKAEAQRWAAITRMGDKQVTLDLNSWHPEVSISDELACRAKDIRERFEEITKDWNRIRLREKDGKKRSIRKWKPTETTSFFDQSQTFGREDEKENIIKWLLQEEKEESNGRSVSVLCIVGMGGLGKTTLAQMVYDDSRVRQHFKLRGWIYVSQDFNVSSLKEKIQQSFDMHKSLDGKKFILVLDDVWNQSLEDWSSLETFIAGVGTGKILITTRNEHVAKIIQTTSHFNLDPLSFDHCWSLFKKIACEGRDHKFLEIGKKIVTKCGGLPLAVKVLAGFLREEDEDGWNDVLKDELWEVDEEEDRIFRVLKLSYEHLPVELKQCFMYLCLFPKGILLSKSIIVEHWISHGFIPPQGKKMGEGKKMAEDVGVDICYEFLNRSILQYLDTRKSNQFFVMHDLIHDLAQFVAKDEYLLMTAPHHVISKTIRHVSVHVKDKSEIINLESLREAKHLRTFILSVHGGMPVMDLLPNFTCLRTLVLPWYNFEDLPDAIGSMKHLRYLEIGGNSIPECVYDLHHLHTLKFSKRHR